jgi:hypothetical protein
MSDKILNPATGRMVSRNGVIGKRIMAAAKPTEKPIAKPIAKPVAAKKQPIYTSWLRTLVDQVKTKFASALKEEKKSDEYGEMTMSMITFHFKEAELVLYFDETTFNKGKLIRYEEDAKISISFRDVHTKPSAQMKKMIDYITSTRFKSVEIEYAPMYYAHDADKLMPYYGDYDQKYTKQKFMDMFTALHIKMA